MHVLGRSAVGNDLEAEGEIEKPVGSDVFGADNEQDDLDVLTAEPERPPERAVARGPKLRDVSDLADEEETPPSPAIDPFEKIEKRIRSLIDERRQLQDECDGLRGQLEEKSLVITELEEQVKGLLSIKEKHQSFVKQQETVRTKVERLLSLLEDEEDQASWPKGP